MHTVDLEALKAALDRRVEWRLFRRRHLFSQNDLATRLGCSRRTVCSVELVETLNPRTSLLKRFRDLKQRYERKVAA